MIINRKLQLSFIISTVLLLLGCASVPGTTDIGRITLNPGDTSICIDSPCTVYFMMPPGEGLMSVWEDGTAGIWETGKFETGKKVELGSYWTGLTVFTVKGVDVPKTWLYVVSAGK